MSKETRDLMAKIEFHHGGKEYDDRYPEGIPTSVVIVDSNGKVRTAHHSPFNSSTHHRIASHRIVFALC